MNGRKVVLVFLFLLFIPLLHATAYEQIDTSLVDQYAQHLIFIYNERADKDQDFDAENHADAMCLYMKKTDRLLVTCFLGNVDNDSIIFFFDKNPYESNFTGVKVEFLFEYDVYNFFPVYIPKSRTIHNPQGTFDFNYTIISPELIQCSSFNDIFNNTEYNSKVLAEEIYEGDKKLAKIDDLFNPFWEKYGDIISSNPILDEKYKMTFDQSSTNSYEEFLQDFNKFNITLHHYLDNPTMFKEWNDFTNYVSTLNYTILVFNFRYNFEKRFSNEFYEINNSIENNESYTYSDFQTDFLPLNQSITDIKTANEKNVKAWNNSILLFLLIFCIITMLTYIIDQNIDDKKIGKILLTIINILLAILFGISANILLSFDEYQILLIISSIFLAALFYFLLIKKLIKKKS